MFKPDTLEKFFTFMPATKRLIQDLWGADRPELIALLAEYMNVMGSNAYGYQYFADMAEHARTAPHSYTDPWKIL